MRPHRRRFLDRLTLEARSAKIQNDPSALAAVCRRAWQTGGGNWLVEIAKAIHMSLVIITELIGAPPPPHAGQAPQGRTVPGGVRRTHAILCHQTALTQAKGRVKSTWNVDGKSKEGRQAVREIYQQHRLKDE